MAQQVQNPHEPQPQERAGGRKHRPWLRWLIVIIVCLLIGIGAVDWIVNNRGPWITILPILIFSVLGVVISLLQWLFPLSSGAHEHHVTATFVPQLSPAGVPVATVQPLIVHVPTTGPLQTLSPVPGKAAYRGIIGFPPPTDSRTISQREKVVKEVYERLISPDITAIVLTGIGGVGKSTLAALIHRYAEEQRRAGSGSFTAEALWLRINPAVTISDLVGTLFEALGKPMLDFGSLTPQNVAVALFNALNTTEQARLIILDQFENLHDAQTGYALPDNAGVGEWLDALNSQPCRCRVLLTCRLWPQGTREYPPTYMQEYHIQGMETDEGIELLRKQGVGSDVTDAELRIAVEHCAGHAFALTLLASFLRRNRSLSLGSLFNNPLYARLWTGDIARNLLDSIYQQQLNEAQRRLLLAFSIYREPVALDAAQAVIDFSAELPAAELPLALDALLRQHLLQAAGEGRYQLHAIVADYARSRFSGQIDLRAAHTRAAHYYLQQAAIHCPPRAQRRRSSDVHELAEAAWQLCQAERWLEAYNLMLQEEFFIDLNRWGGNAILLELYELLLPVDRWHAQAVQAACIYNNLGAVCRALGQMGQAQEHLERALHICKEEGDRAGEAWALNNLGRVHSVLGYRERALEYYEQALQICREMGERGDEVMNLNNLAGVYRALVQRKKALEYCEQALSIAREIGDRGEEASALNNLGEVYSAQGQAEQARQYYEEALGIQREVGDRVEEGWTLNNLGKLYDDIGQEERALKYLEQSLSIRREVGDHLGEGRTLKNLGKLYDHLGQKERALEYLEQSFDICRGVDRWGEGKVLSNLGKVYADLGLKQRALEYYEQALRIRREIRDRGGESKTLDDLGKLYTDLGQIEQALHCYGQTLKIRKELEDRSGEGTTLYNLGVLYFGCGKYDVALACFLLARDIVEEVQGPQRDKTQRGIDNLRGKIGEEAFDELLAKVKAQAQQVVERALSDGT